ncbi:metabotropic glutamate receptor 7-like [Dendronephthya gigantea]|uniref:metabotropic glutamate receptor 7-like n=1 Tax=Dendronephthya gigantea TaxID=151771 RepID=UPI00106A8B48|nr:metabotropic glutamate receptor 7-like [Dendronephthya gigantea]
MKKMLCGFTLLMILSYGPSNLVNAKGAMVTKGDVIIGGLFAIHKKSKKSENECGEFNELNGYQYMEAMMFAIDKINHDKSILPNITLGTQIYDTCYSKTIAADRAKEFIKQSLVDNNSGQLAGVVGALTSEVSLVVANFLRVFEIPQISYASTSEVLSNKDIYSYFLRTVPPDSFQVRAMIDIIKKFGWTYISTVNSPGEYGENGIRNVKKLAREEGICIDVEKQLSSFPTDREYRDVIEALLKSARETNMSTVVLFLSQTDARKLFEAASMYDDAQRFTWIGNDGWSNIEDITAEAGESALGLLEIEIQRGEVLKEFKDYFLNLNLTNYPRGHMGCFHEFWEEHFHCHLTGSQSQINKNKFNKTCSGNETLANTVPEFSPVRVVINAVYAFAHALDSLQKELCPGQEGMCKEMKDFKRPRLLEHLKNVSFQDPTLKTTVEFDENLEVSAMYDILNVQKKNNVRRFTRVGGWNGHQKGGKIYGRLELNTEKIQWRRSLPTAPPSFCTSECERNSIRVPSPERPFKCCWQCKGCGKLQIVNVNNTCVSGPDGWQPNANYTGFDKREVLYPTWNDPASIAFILISIVCLFLTLFTVLIYFKHKDNRLVKASGRELCFVILAGISLCFILPFMFIAKPNDPVCYARNLVIGLALAMCYAPLFMKINRIYRIFTSARSSVARPALVTPRMQLLVTLALVSIQLMFTALWFVAKPVRAKETYYSEREELVLECEVDALSFSVNLCYVMVLMALCTAYAFKTRTFPKNFNESKYIGITMYVTCATWTCFFPFYLNTKYSSTHVYLVSGACILIGLVTLLGLFAQKVYIIYLVHDLRTDDLVMTSRSLPRRSEDKREISANIDMTEKMNGGANGHYEGVVC